MRELWIVFGIIAAVTGIVNLLLGLAGKKSYVWMALSLSFTILYMIAHYDLVTYWVIRSDWSALEDVVPTMNMRNETLCVASIVVNLIPVIKKFSDDFWDWTESIKSKSFNK